MEESESDLAPARTPAGGAVEQSAAHALVVGLRRSGDGRPVLMGQLFQRVGISTSEIDRTPRLRVLRSAPSPLPSREGLQPRVECGEVAVGDDVRREQAAGVDAAELLEFDAPCQPWAALALGLVA